jgi:glutathione S-transferase
MNYTNNPQPLAEKFNCAQRAHANFLENAPQTMFFTMVAGLKYPELAAGLGALWVVFRALFLHGYVYGGKAQGMGRLRGSLFWLVQGALWGLSVFGVGRDLLDF